MVVHMVTDRVELMVQRVMVTDRVDLMVRRVMVTGQILIVLIIKDQCHSLVVL